MNAAGHLLIEEGVAGNSGDAGIGADGELAKLACAVVYFEHGRQVVAALLGAEVRHTAALESQRHALDSPATVGGGVRVGDLSSDRLFYRRSEDLAAGEIALPVGVDEVAALDAHGEVGARPFDVDFSLTCQPIDDVLLLAGDLAPAVGGALIAVQEAGMKDEVL